MEKDFEIIDDEEFSDEPQLIETIQPVKEETDEDKYMKQFNKANFKPIQEMTNRKVKIISEQTQKDWKFFDLTTYSLCSWQETGKNEQQRLNEHIVERRYSDFEWLYFMLKKYFQGLIIPKPPQKDIKAKLEFIDKQNILEERKQGFVIFINKLLEHPRLKYSNILYLFLTLTNEEFTTIKEESNVNTNDLVLQDNFISNVQDKIKDGFSNVFSYLTGGNQQADSESNITEIEAENIKETQQFEEWEFKYDSQKIVLQKIKNSIEQIMIQKNNELKQEQQFFQFFNEESEQTYYSNIKIKSKITKSLSDSQLFRNKLQDQITYLNSMTQENYRHLENCVEILAQRKIIAQNIQQTLDLIKTQTGKKDQLQNQLSLLKNRYRTLCWQFKSDIEDFDSKFTIQMANITKQFIQFVETQNSNLTKIWK